MTSRPAVCCIILILFIAGAGCMTGPVPGSPVTAIAHPSAPPDPITPLPLSAKNAAVNTSFIPLLFTDYHWQTAGSCGWSKDDIAPAEALFMESCRVKSLLRDGWTIAGMRYDTDFLGSRCRRSVHPDAAQDCDWCADAGPTLVLRYQSVETELMAHPGDRTVTPFKTSLPDGAASVSDGDAESIVFRNGTVLYTFRHC